MKMTTSLPAAVAVILMSSATVNAEFDAGLYGLAAAPGHRSLTMLDGDLDCARRQTKSC